MRKEWPIVLGDLEWPNEEGFEKYPLDLGTRSSPVSPVGTFSPEWWGWKPDHIGFRTEWGL